MKDQTVQHSTQRKQFYLPNEAAEWLVHNHGKEEAKKIILRALAYGAKYACRFSEFKLNRKLKSFSLEIPGHSLTKYAAWAQRRDIGLDRFLSMSADIGLRARKKALLAGKPSPL